MKNALKLLVIGVIAVILTGCAKEEPLDVSNDPPKGAASATMNSASQGGGNSAGPAGGAKPQGAKAESQ